jgi:hypothetical protein
MSCREPLPVEVLVDYFAGDLSNTESERIDLHLLSCAECSAGAGALAPLLAALYQHVPYVLSAAGLHALECRKLRIASSVVPADARTLVPFPDDADLLVIKLKAPLTQVAQLDCELRTLDGHPILALTDVPFDAQEGSVQIACQRHFLELYGPSEFKVTLFRIDEDAPRVPIAEYTLRHV